MREGERETFNDAQTSVLSQPLDSEAGADCRAKVHLEANAHHQDMAVQTDSEQAGDTAAVGRMLEEAEAVHPDWMVEEWPFSRDGLGDTHPHIV